MKFSEQWLRSWVDPPITRGDLAEQLTMAGLEVDSITAVAPAFSSVVVGEIVVIEPHPDADKLRMCRVNAGEYGELQIVCGAANARQHLKAPLALVGASLPGGMTIRPTRLRGIESQGMLCSAAELGLSEAAQGLMELPASAPTGAALRDYLQLDDQAIEIDLTPNRGDCLSVIGVAREVAMLNKMDLRRPAMESVAARIDATFAIDIMAEEACPRYVGRVIKGVNMRAVTPLWMAERLRRSGLRSINAVVDVTNYVLLELGQPMHAFDLAKLHGGIEVRTAHPGEQLTLLDGQQLSLSADTLVIADQHRVIALAGIMGGLDTAVGESTRDIFFESAFFAPEMIAGRARCYGLHTDSSHRFERGVDFRVAAVAIERATTLLMEIAGGQPGPVSERAEPAFLPQRNVIDVRKERLDKLLGIDLSRDEVSDILQRLELQVAAGETGWQVVPPSFRFDLSVEADIIEEIARVYGYNRIPASLPSGRLSVVIGFRQRTLAEQSRNVLTDRGYQEVITYSFVDEKLQQRMDPKHRGLALANPIAADLAVMRTSLWPSLLSAMEYNHRRQTSRVRIFEIASRYLNEAGGLREEKMIAAAASGSVLPEQWGAEKRDVDYYDLKSDMMALVPAGIELHFSAEAHSALHPGRCACLRDHNCNEVGWIGELHPAIVKESGLAAGIVLFEIQLAALEQVQPIRFTPWSKYPAVRRDIAVIVDDALAAQEVCESVRQIAGKYLVKLQLFDVYRGKGIDSGKKSLALGLTLQDFSRTLTDGEVDDVMERIIVSLKQEIGAILRD